MIRRRLLTGLAIFASSLLVVGLWLNSHAALRWLLDKTNDALPGELQVTVIEGTPLGPINLQGIHYQSPELKVTLRQLQLDWRPWHLLRGKIHLQQLELEALQVRFSEHARPGGVPDLPVMVLPLPVEIRSAHLSDTLIFQAHPSPPLHLDQIELRGMLDRDNIRLASLAIRFDTIALDISGDIQPIGRYPLDIKVDWSANRAELQPLRGTVTIDGNINQLNVDALMQQPPGSRFIGHVQNPFTNLRWQGDLQLQALHLPELADNLPALTISGKGEVEGTLREVRLHDSQLKTHLPDLGLLGANLDLVFADKVLTLNESRLWLEQTGTKLWLTGQLDTRTRPLQIETQARWQDFQWPLQSSAVIRSPSGSLRASGNPDAWRFNLTDTGIDYRQLQIRNIRARGTGDARHMELAHLQARLLDGQITGKARINWLPQIHWQAELSGQNLDPSTYPHALSEPLHGKLMLGLQSQGTLQDRRLVADVTLKKLDGKLRGQPLTGKGQVRLRQASLELDDIALNFADIKLRTHGSIADNWDLHWQLDAPDIRPALPSANGSIKTQGQLTGPRDTPVIQASLAARDVRIDSRLGVKHLQSKLDIDLKGVKTSRLELSASQLHYKQFELKRLTFDGRGNRAAHQMKAEVSHREGNLSLALNGRLDDDGHWRGEILKSALESKLAGLWQQQAPGQLDIARDHFSLTATCWINQKARLCGQSDQHDKRNWLTDFDIQQVPLSLFQPLLRSQFRLHGRINGKGRLQVVDGELKNSRLKLGIEDGGLDYQTDEQKAPVIQFSQTQLRLEQATDGHYEMTARMDYTPTGFLQTNASLKPVKGQILRHWPVQGRLQINTQQLDMLRLLYPQLGKINGELVSDIRLAGSVAKPQWQGELAIAQASIEVPPLGIVLQDLNLELTSPQANQLELRGRLKSDGGDLEMGGRLGLDSQKGRPGQLRISGAHFRIVNLDTARVLISPDIKVHKQGQLIDISGSVTLPSADVRSVEVPHSVPISTNVVFIDEEKTEPRPKRKESALQVRSRIDIILGEAVNFNGYGLKGRLTGKVSVADEPGKITTGQGDLHIADGRYRAFGVDLKIDIGRILFTGGAVSDPGISATATRRAGNVTAGVRIRGPLRNPLLSVFSIPSMPENEALSYLLFGRKMTNISFSDEDFTKPGGDSSPQAIGTILSPTSVTRMRFRLTDSWELHTESAAPHTATDVIYTFEK